MNIDTKHDLTVEAIRVSPTVALAGLGQMTATDLLTWLSIIYMIGLIAFHIRRWWKAEKHWRRNESDDL